MTKSILRATTLIALASTAFIAMCMHPDTIRQQIAIGLAGLISFIALIILYSKWIKTDRLIASYHRWATKGANE